MLKKMYAKCCIRSRQIETIFYANNDDEAQYIYSLANIKAKETNPYYNDDDYLLACLGVIEMEFQDEKTKGEYKMGIKYEYADDFPVIFDEIKDYNKPKYNQPSVNDISVDDEDKAKNIIKKSKGI